MAQNKIYKIATAIVTVFGIGWLKFAPGTFGTIFGIIFYYTFLKYWTTCYLFLFLALLLIISVISIDIYIKKKNIDPKEVVIDEFLATIAICVVLKNFIQFSPLNYTLVFIIFRFFDITKVAYIKRFEVLSGSLGIIADDIIAAIYTAIIVTLFNSLPI